MTAIVIAFAVFVAAAVFAWATLSERVQEGAPSTPTPATSGSPTGVELSSFPEGWTELPAPPDIRSGAAQVWTGSQLLIWGGSSGWSDEQPPERDGMAFDASSNTWIAIPPAPIPGRSFPAYAWTGRELLIWGGWDGSYSEEEPGTLSDGAAYDPATNQWRMLPPSGLTARAPLFAWTGEELIVWGTSFRTRIGRRTARRTTRTRTRGG